MLFDSNTAPDVKDDPFTVVWYNDHGAVQKKRKITRSELKKYRISSLLLGEKAVLRYKDVIGHNIGNSIPLVDETTGWLTPVFPSEVVNHIALHCNDRFDPYNLKQAFVVECCAELGFHVDLTTAKRRAQFLRFCIEVTSFIREPTVSFLNSKA